MLAADDKKLKLNSLKSIDFMEKSFLITLTDFVLLCNLAFYGSHLIKSVEQRHQRDNFTDK